MDIVLKHFMLTTACSALSAHSHICECGSFLNIKCCSWAHILREISDWLLPKYNLNWLKIEQSHANPVALATLLTANFTSTPEGVKGNLLITNTLWQWKEMTVHQKVFSNITIVAPICNHLTLPSTTWSLENSYRKRLWNISGFDIGGLPTSISFQNSPYLRLTSTILYSYKWNVRWITLQGIGWLYYHRSYLDQKGFQFVSWLLE